MDRPPTPHIRQENAIEDKESERENAVQPMRVCGRSEGARLVGHGPLLHAEGIEERIVAEVERVVRVQIGIALDLCSESE